MRVFGLRRAVLPRRYPGSEITVLLSDVEAETLDEGLVVLSRSDDVPDEVAQVAETLHDLLVEKALG